MSLPPNILAALGPQLPPPSGGPGMVQVGPPSMPGLGPPPGLLQMQGMPGLAGPPPMPPGMMGPGSMLPGSDAGPIPGMGPMGMPPMGPPPGMMGMPPPEPPPSQPKALDNPMDDPIVQRMLYASYEAAMTDQEESKKGPFHPQWYTDSKETMYPKPSESDIQDKAQRDATAYAALLDRFQDDLDLLSSDARLAGTYPDFDPENEESFYSSALVAEKNLIKAKIGGIEPIFASRNKSVAERDKVQDTEDFIYALDEEADRQFHAEFGGHRKMALADNALVYGRMVQRNLPNWKTDDDGIPFSMKVMDPSIVFPTFEGPHGLGTVTCRYIQSVRMVIRDHPQYAKDIRTKVMPANDKRDDALLLDDDVEVTEYWDRRWFALLVDSKMIIPPQEHDLGEPPFVYTLVERGETTHTTSPRNASSRSRNNQTGVPTGRRQADILHRGESFVASRRRTHAQKEAVLGIMATELRNKTNPPIIVEQDDFAWEKGMPEITGARGGRSQVWKNHEEAKPYPERPAPQEYGPLLQAAAEDLSREGMPPTSYGINRNSNVSGYAVDQLNDTGMDKMTPELLAMQSFFTACHNQLLRMMKNFGHLLGKKGDRGKVTVSRNYPVKGQGKHGEYAEITAYTIRCAGCETLTKMNTLSLQSMGPLANTLQMVQNMGLITREDAVRMLQLPGYRNPEETIKKVDLEKMKDQPEYKMAELIRWLIEDGDEGDKILADFLAKQLMTGRLKEAQALGSGAPGMGAPGSQGPGPMAGVSMPPMGQPPGPGSGPPPGPGGPPPGLPGLPPPGMM